MIATALEFVLSPEQNEAVTAAGMSLAGLIGAMTLVLPRACVRDSAGDFCLIYQPVYTAATDTERTKEQVDSNNAVWVESCGR